MNTNLTRDEALQGLANAMDGLIGLHKNPETNEEVPSSAFVDLIQNELQVSAIHYANNPNPFYWAEAGNLDRAKFVEYLRVSNADQAASTKWAKFLFTTEGGMVTDKPNQLSYATLKYGRKELAKSHEPCDRFLAVGTAAFIAALRKPESLSDGEIPRKRKSETDDQLVFRTAINNLLEFSRLAETREAKLWGQAYRELQARDIEDKHDGMMALPENEHLRIGCVNLQLSIASRNLCSRILSEDFSSEQFHNEISSLILFEKQRQKDDEKELLIEETNWEILPPEVLKRIQQGVSESTGAPYERVIEQDRLRWLASLAIQWDPSNAYIAIADLRSSGEHDYLVAVLPQKLPDGTVIEHAVAENPTTGNAVYVFRAEKGFAAGGRTVSWQDVLSRSKFIARALGARKVVHNQYVEDNVLEYLTRPEDELDRPGYKR